MLFQILTRNFDPQAQLEAAKKSGKHYLVYKTDMGNDGKMIKR